MNDAVTAPSMADRAGALVALASEQTVPRQVFSVAGHVAALANEPAERAAELAHRAISAGLRPLPEQGDGPWFSTAIRVLFWAEHYDEAQVLIDAAVAEARAAANGLVLPAMLSERAWLAFRRGDLTAAEADARALLLADVPAPPLWRLLGTGVLVAALVERGEFDEAEHQLGSVAADLHGTFRTVAVLRHSRGLLRVAQRRLGERSTTSGRQARLPTAPGRSARPACRGAPTAPWWSSLSVTPVRRDGWVRRSWSWLTPLAPPVPSAWRCGPPGSWLAARMARSC
jgi:hypothetical protein